MYPFAKQGSRIVKPSLTYYSSLIDHCVSLKSLALTQILHAHLIKVGFNCHTFVGNRCLDLYCKVGCVGDVNKVFSDLSCRNTISWNVLLKGLLHFGCYELACSVFDKMPQRDVVSWNTMISAYISGGLIDHAWKMFGEMLNVGLRPSGFTYSITMSVVDEAFRCKELHGSLIRSGLSASNVVLGNCLIDMYGRLGFLDYAFAVFLRMKELDVISWNSLITGCCKAGYVELALNQFYVMRHLGYLPDEFTYSSVIASCSHSRNLDKGKQIFTLCLKVGFLYNTIVSSAAIDLFSKCNRLEDSVRLFNELHQWDCALCNSIISSLVWHGFGDEALRIFVLAMRKDVKPTEFMFSSILSSISALSAEQGTQVHSLVIKSGLEGETLVASSLVEMYLKFGFPEDSMKIFNKMVVKDLISWNSLIIGLTRNSRVVEALETFKELLRNGPPPDRITFAGVLLACSRGGLASEGIKIFATMEETYEVIPGNDHYVCLVGLLCQAGLLSEAIYIIEAMPHDPGSAVWRLLLSASIVRGDLKLTETVAERLINLEPQSSLPYMVLSWAYEMRGQWEGMVRVRNTMDKRAIKKVSGCSWIGIRNHIYNFEASQLQHPGGIAIYWVLQLLNLQIDDERCFFV